MKTKNKTKITYKIISLFIILLISSSVLMPLQDTNAKGNEMVVIPKKAVRLRILANSDSSEDQALKRKVRDEVNAQINTWVKDLKSFEEGQKVIQSHIPDLKKTVERVMKEEGSNQTFTITYSKKVKFPTKLYGSFLYPAGDYEAVLIKIGAGQGANWWCVLFPPLCFLDFSNGDATLNTETLQSQQKIEKETKIEEEPEEVKGIAYLNDEEDNSSKAEKEVVKKDDQVRQDREATEVAVLPTVESNDEVKVESFFVQMIKQLF
jgi:stage II sporulation protein R